ncbi:(2Fe-2S)-binding protein [Acrocarpospora corrugata]|uniref:(2Fe-2S)-binding protein n=1 Tax=Acrocarpospora corrugata TaxID=35763 RepID=A0A5M3VR10_9ACTN|nr:aromatic ring-hydroxylating dioxygenase subunit alpha [Acrocarpospora corrugata]GER98628.1 (2Fe-2S)-binding protein [Acrocarpospora corrugata]
MNTAPLDLDAVRACLEPPGMMLPRDAYTSDDVLAWERRVVFGGGWVCAGRATTLGPRSRMAVAVGDDSVLLVRDEDGTLRGFYNVCRHRGHELLPCGSSATGRFIACPYHNWVYDLRGDLHRIPRAEPPKLGLVPVPVVEWHGFVFVNASGDAPPIGDYLAGLEEIAAPYGMADLEVAASHDYELNANWKLAVENYHECYHCPAIHPELCRISPPDSGDNYRPAGLWAGGKMDLIEGAQTMSMDGASGAGPLPGITGDRLRIVEYVQLFPNLLLSMHPDYVMTHVLEPVSADRTRVTCQWLFPPGTTDVAYAVDFWDLTNRQDWSACEGVQRGVSSRGYRPGPFSADEDVTYQWIATMATAYLTGRAPALPERI